MINVPCLCPSMSAIAIALTNMPVMIHTISIIWDSIWLVVLLWHSTWLWWSLLPYVYAQINGYCHYYYPECYIETHTSTYGTHGRFLETCTVWLFWVDYNFVALGILSTTWWFLYPRPISNQKKIFQTQNGVSPVRLCLQPLYCFYCVRRVTVHTLPTLSRSVPPYPLCYSLAILYPHKSTSSPMCMAGGRCGKGSLDQACAQITTLVSVGNDW